MKSVGEFSDAGLREKLNKIMASDYFTATPEMRAPVDVAAAGNYVPFQVQLDGSSLQVTDVPVEQEVRQDAQYEQKVRTCFLCCKVNVFMLLSRCDLIALW